MGLGIVGHGAVAQNVVAAVRRHLDLSDPEVIAGGIFVPGYDLNPSRRSPAGGVQDRFLAAVAQAGFRQTNSQGVGNGKTVSGVDSLWRGGVHGGVVLPGRTVSVTEAEDAAALGGAQGTDGGIVSSRLPFSRSSGHLRVQIDIPEVHAVRLNGVLRGTDRHDRLPGRILAVKVQAAAIQRNTCLYIGDGQRAVGNMYVAQGINADLTITEGQGAALVDVQNQIRQGAVDRAVRAAGPGELIQGDVLRHVQNVGLGVKGKAGNAGVQIDLRKFRAVQPQAVLQGIRRLSGDFHLISPAALTVIDGFSGITKVSDNTALRYGNDRGAGGKLDGGPAKDGGIVFALRAGSNKMDVVSGGTHRAVADSDGVGSENASGLVAVVVRHRIGTVAGHVQICLIEGDIPRPDAVSAGCNIKGRAGIRIIEENVLLRAVDRIIGHVPDAETAAAGKAQVCTGDIEAEVAVGGCGADGAGAGEVYGQNVIAAGAVILDVGITVCAGDGRIVQMQGIVLRVIADRAVAKHVFLVPGGDSHAAYIERIFRIALGVWLRGDSDIIGQVTGGS